jgi:hypothetical protein
MSQRTQEAIVLLLLFGVEITCGIIMFNDIRRYSRTLEGLLLVLICVIAAWGGLKVVFKWWREDNWS